MSSLISALVRGRGRMLTARFDAGCANPERAQQAFLRRVLARNATTRFGQAHGFASIVSAAAYARRVPVRDYEALRPWVEDLVAGATGVLTAEPPFMFAATSGTTSRPKLIPVTRTWLRELSAVTRLWLSRSLADHPGLLDGRMAAFSGAAVEAHTAGGLPIGSISGVTCRNVPRLLRRRYALPDALSDVASCEDRYAIAARMLLAADVSLLATANPTTLLRLAEIADEQAARIVAAVHDGRLGMTAQNAAQAEIHARLEAGLRPDPGRARLLESCIERSGRLLPWQAWPRLKMIGCWLGGTAGLHAGRLADWYGPVPLRDLGYRATEATVTLPIRDHSPAGILAPGTNFYEFVPVEEIGSPEPRTLLAHELTAGARYSIVLTTSSGLYRYDINDIVEVQGFHRRSPLLAFVRKGRDMTSITGEKLHADQVVNAFHGAVADTQLPVVQLQLVADPERRRYDLLVELPDPEQPGLGRFCAAFDRRLGEQNFEYRDKRRSLRLVPPQPWLMKPGWSARRQRADVERRGGRDAQFKWPILKPEWDEETRREVAPASELDGRGRRADKRLEVGGRCT